MAKTESKNEWKENSDFFILYFHLSGKKAIWGIFKYFLRLSSGRNWKKQ